MAIKKDYSSEDESWNDASYVSVTAIPVPGSTEAESNPTNVPENNSIAATEVLDNTTQEENTSDDKTKQIGAGVVTAIVCIPFLGPVLAAVAGVAASQGVKKDGAIGDVCRAAGDVAAVAKDKAFEVNNKHRIVEKTRSGAQDLMSKTQNPNGRHEILDSAKAGIIRVFLAIGNLFNSAAEKLNKKDDQTKPKDNSECEVLKEERS